MIVYPLSNAETRVFRWTKWIVVIDAVVIVGALAGLSWLAR